MNDILENIEVLDLSSEGRRSPDNSIQNESVPHYLNKINEIVRSVSDATNLQLDRMQENQRIHMKDLVRKVASFLNLAETTIAPIVSVCIYSSPNCTVKKGRNGGIFKGRMIRAVRPEPARCAHCGQKIRANKKLNSPIESKYPSIPPKAA